MKLHHKRGSRMPWTQKRDILRLVGKLNLSFPEVKTVLIDGSRKLTRDGKVLP